MSENGNRQPNNKGSFLNTMISNLGGVTPSARPPTPPTVSPPPPPMSSWQMDSPPTAPAVASKASPVPANSPPVVTYNEVDAAVSSLDLLLSDGRRFGIQYYLMRPLVLERSGQQIQLRCDTYTLTIGGYRLGPLYKSLLAGRVTQIEPAVDTRFAANGRDPVVTTVTLKDA